MVKTNPPPTNRQFSPEPLGGHEKSMHTPKSVDKKIAARVERLLGQMNTPLSESASRKVYGVGKDKLIVEHESSSKVYMLPQASFLGRCRRNIVKEVQFILGIKKALPKEEMKNLAVDIDPDNTKARVWTTDKAEGNLEKMMGDADCKMQSKDFCQDIVRGMKNLHKAGYVHGDMKLENMLVVQGSELGGQKYIKVSDFGKGAKVVEGKPSGIYSGNTRYGPPEGRTSKAGDVYGAGICIIRILEEQFLGDKTSLVAVHETRTKIPPAHKERRGVEKYILEEPAFTRSYEQKGSFKGKVLDFFARVRTVAGVDKQKLSFEQDAMNRYIDVLTTKLQSEGGLDKEKAAFLNQMLKNMTSVDPSARPTMEVVDGELKDIFK